MRIIGAGFGGTGTLALKLALERLGFGPCCHPTDLLRASARMREWRALAEGERPDWARLLRGYRSTADWPAAAYWAELTRVYPMARVILTVRDPHAWYEDMYRHYRKLRLVPEDSPAAVDYASLTARVVWGGVFGGRFADRAEAITRYETHNERVREFVPQRRLLVHRAEDGWRPLCEFLGTPVPAENFPLVNEMHHLA